jgi:acyl-CoA synthetase (AMP-forming)/AMP-acid ligase II
MWQQEKGACRKPLALTHDACTATRFVFPQAARSFGNKAAIIDGMSGRTITYADLPLRIGTAAKAMASKGVRDGDVVAIHMPNSPEYIIAFQSVAQLGAINTTSNPLYTPSELAHQFRDSGAKFAITIPALLDTVKKVGVLDGLSFQCVYARVYA